MRIDMLLTQIRDAVWGLPLIVLVITAGLIMTVRLRGVQTRRMGAALLSMKGERGAGGDVSNFGAMCTAIAATVGTGNVVGVATAIKLGGPGALFWMLLVSLLGLALKYAEGLLAVKYRVRDAQGNILGGPFFYIERGMGARWKPLAKAFAAFGGAAALLGIGTTLQSNSMAQAVRFMVTPQTTAGDAALTIALALVIAALSAYAINGGIKRIAGVSSVLVPVMVLMYVGGCAVIVAQHGAAFGETVRLIFSTAFAGAPVLGGFAGAGVMTAIRYGVSRGIMASESGLGSAPIVAAAAETDKPARQGLVQMAGTFLGSIMICAMSGLAIITSGAWAGTREGVDITLAAFNEAFAFLPGLGAGVVAAALITFAYTSIIGWCYYGERCLAYLSGERPLMLYRGLYILMVFLGPFVNMGAVWTAADILNGLMAFPNLIALIALSGVAAAESRRYFGARERKSATRAIPQKRRFLGG